MSPPQLLDDDISVGEDLTHVHRVVATNLVVWQTLILRGVGQVPVIGVKVLAQGLEGRLVLLSNMALGLWHVVFGELFS